ncbi:MAG TPA: HD domain-containing phosphohydrolase [Opitutaceae bacterium]
MSEKILCVDDDSNVLAGFQRSLRKEFAIDTALGGVAALAAIGQKGPYAVVVADMQMPGMSGIQFLQEVERTAPDTVRLMLTGNADQKTAMDAVNHGHVYRFLTKPCPAADLGVVLKAALKQYRLITAERELLENTLNGAIAALTGILVMMDPVAFGIGEKLRDYMRRYARHAQLPEAWSLELAAMMSQIGYVAIPLKVLVKARGGSTLTPEEKDMLSRVPRTGADLLARIPRLDGVARIVLYQGRGFNGTGFPSDDVAGAAIPIGARILKVLGDLLDAEVRTKSRAKALELLRGRPEAYDPEVLRSVEACFESETEGASGAIATPGVVELEAIGSGQVFAANVETKEGTLLAVAGTVISPVLIEKLRNFEQLVGLKRPLLVLKQVHPAAAA